MKQEYDFSEAERGRFFRENARLRFPISDKKPDWVSPEGPLGKFIVEEATKTLRSYCAQPHRVTEDANSEQFTAHGGYAHRQLFELVQNSADALLNSSSGKSILIRLTDGFLYCADDGAPIDEDGIVGLMFSRISSKRNTPAIGRFGLGFKSVLGVTDAPEFYSRSVSFRFDKKRAAERIAGAMQMAQAERYPVLRLPDPIDPREAMNSDEELRELMNWATNIVRLPLKPGTYSDLSRQIGDFPPEFLLFVDHVRYLTIEDGECSREFMLHRRDGELLLDTAEGSARWLRFDATHTLSAKARADWPLHDDSDDAPVQWAAPLDRLDRPGYFWAFFPTDTASLVAGILNAPWKTNEDRQNLLPGPYNEELIEAAAKMITDVLPKLATRSDPGRHLDALPRRHEAGDTHLADHLRDKLYSNLCDRKLIPNQKGDLHIVHEINYPPSELAPRQTSAVLERWAAYPGRPSGWVHHSALTRNRLASIDRLYHPEDEPFDESSNCDAPRAVIHQWLQALVAGKEADEAVRASMAAIQTAIEIPSEIRSKISLGNIVLTEKEDWQSPDPERLFLPDESLSTVSAAEPEFLCVHPKLVLDNNTLSALKELGLRPPSPESRFKSVAKQIFQGLGNKEVDDELYREFWFASRKLSSESAKGIILEYRDNWVKRELWPTKLRVRTQAGTWQPSFAVLLPGEIVPEDGNRDGGVAVDTQFHELDYKLLCALGVTDTPQDRRDLSFEKSFGSYRASCRKAFRNQDNLPHTPSWESLIFESTIGPGPLQVLALLSDTGCSLYVNRLLELDSTFQKWKMRHRSVSYYSEMLTETLTINMIREYGRIQTTAGISPIDDALGSSPKSPEALHALLNHPKAGKIKEAFHLAEPTPEFFGEADSVPLTDIWPGLTGYLPSHRKQCRLVPCERIRVVGQSRECIFHAPDVYLVGAVDDDPQYKLQLVANELELRLSSRKIEAILLRKTPDEIEERRAAIRQHSTDAERLLVAVGEQRLRTELPGSLVAVLEKGGATLTGTDVAEAAIATYHTDALKKYKWALDHLDPPSGWAGSARAVKFVRSLGFSAEWAGERNRRPEPFLEVEGRFELPPLHDYQEIIVHNVREMLHNSSSHNGTRRGMISMPTGSGKTRVAVQAIVEAMRDDGFEGGVLWVADRDELCEQAVEAWRQVWSSIGPGATQLRISRMWAGQPRPLPTSELHIVVATIQTLSAKLSRQQDEYNFLKDFALIVFDEAHRSIAPTFTSVMDEIGLTRRQRTDEPFLIGLTATPYRGYNEEETKWLTSRYSGNRLDSEAFESDDAQDVIQQLQTARILARADHETIEGETFSLDDILEGSPRSDNWRQKLDKLLELPWLPQIVEDRIAQSAERTERIIEAYGAHIDSDWPTLVFATSVEHAQTVAALLNRDGIRARAVSGETETATRRRVVEEFRHGEIKALVNYGVFREGFDAPKTRAIIVARPVYSPNLYFQMIGRGLRGPLNGGDERCLILNVRDNIEQFDRALSFSELDWLWA